METYAIVLVVVLPVAAVVALASLCIAVGPGGVAYWLIMNTPLGECYRRHQIRSHTPGGTYTHAQAHSHMAVYALGRLAAPSAVVCTVAFMEDNYAYLIIETASGEMTVVDPGDAAAAITCMRTIEAAFTASHGSDPTARTAPPQGINVSSTVWLRLVDALHHVQHAPRLTRVLVTHYHFDHAGGVPELTRAFPGLCVVSSAHERDVSPGHADVRRVTHDDVVLLGQHISVRVLVCACHTRGHVMFLLTDDDEEPARALFSGDTLFVAGVGRFFEGTAAQMHAILYELLPRVCDLTHTHTHTHTDKAEDKAASDGAAGDVEAAAKLHVEPLGPPTAASRVLLFPGHEYAAENLSFSAWIEPRNAEVARKLAEVRALRSGKTPTVGSAVQDEVRYNPFLRVTHADVRAAVKMHASEAVSERSDVQVLAALRGFKDKKLHKKAGATTSNDTAVRHPPP